MILVVFSIFFCIIAFIYLMVLKVSFKDALSFTVVLLVASIPLAVEIVCTTTLALGSGVMAKYGAIVSRLSAIEDLAGLNVLCSDKTGTLTLNKMAIQPECPTFIKDQPNLDRAEVPFYFSSYLRLRFSSGPSLRCHGCQVA
jgi:H+-transporting ATPase